MTDKHQFVGKKVRLGDVCSIVSGATPKTAVADYWNGDIKWVTPAELDDNSHVIYDTAKHLTEKGFSSASLHMLPKGTVLLTTRAPIGKVAIAGEEMCCNQGFKNLICSDVINNEYLYRYLKSRSSELQALGRGATFKELSKKSVAAYELNLPPLNYQLEAVEKLTFVDNQITAVKAQLDELDSLVKSRFVEMFEDKGYPVSYLSHLTSSMRNGMSPSKSGSHHSKVLTLSAVTQGRFNSAAWKDGFFAEKPPIDKHVSVDDFYVCRGNGNIHLVGSGEYPDRPMEDVIFPDTMIAAKIKQGQIILPYLRYAWAQSSTRRQIEASAKTTNGTFKINQTMLGNIKIPVPPLKIQQEFADFAASVDKSRFVAQQQIEKLQMLYDSLAQEYFGE